MLSLLLKKALPFTLTFVVGAGLGWLFSPSTPGYRTLTVETFEPSAPSPPELPRGHGSRGRRECQMRGHLLVAETKPLDILFKPRVHFHLEYSSRVRLNVTFGADGKVQEVSPVASWVSERSESRAQVKAMLEAADSAARRIEFTPETVNGVPVTVTREVEMEFGLFDYYD